MDRNAFKQRMQALKSYRESNPGKGYWDWKVQSFEDGGEVSREQQAIQNALNAKGTPNQFMDTWNQARLATGNFNDQLGDGKLELQKANRDATAIYKSPGKYGFNSYLRGTPIIRSATMTEQEAIQKHVQFAEQFGYGTRTRMQNTNQKGLVGTQITVGEYNPRGRAIYAPTEDVLTHEQAHASKAYPQENRIQEILGGENKATTDYLDRPTEVYSRLMDFRQINNIDPSQVWDKKALKELKKTGTDVDLLNRYKDDQLLDLFNTVADIGTERNYVQPQYLAEGGEVGDPDDEFTKAINTKLGRTPDGRPLQQGLKPVFDLEDAANLTPVGDAIAAKDMYNAAMDKDWTGLGLAAASMIPFVPSGMRKINKKFKQIPSVHKDTQQLLDAKFQELDKLAQRKADYGNEQYRIMERVMEDPSYMNRAREVKQKFGDDYSIPYADMFIAYNVDPDVLPNVQLMDELKKAGSMRRTADGKFIYKRNPDNDYIPNTAEHELSHFTDLLKSGRPDAHAGNNVFYQMTKDLTKRVGDKHDDYFLLPTEQKAHMNQLREWMFQNGYINRRDQKVTPEYMSKIMKQLNNVEGMKGVQRAAQQFKSNKTFTKWFNSVPLIGAGLLGVNKYFTDEDKQEK